MHISQPVYIQDMLERYGMANCSPVSTPLNPFVTLTQADCVEITRLYKREYCTEWAKEVGCSLKMQALYILSKHGHMTVTSRPINKEIMHSHWPVGIHTIDDLTTSLISHIHTRDTWTVLVPVQKCVTVMSTYTPRSVTQVGGKLGDQSPKVSLLIYVCDWWLVDFDGLLTCLMACWRVCHVMSVD